MNEALTSDAVNLGADPAAITPEKPKRIRSIDRFRGFCVFSMVIFQFLSHFPSLGFLSRLAVHDINQGIVILPGMTLADIIAPAFIFAIGLTYALSFYNWLGKFGLKSAIIHYVERALALVGIGAFTEISLNVVEAASGRPLNEVDITCLVFGSIAIVGIILVVVSGCTKNKLFRKISSQVLYISLSCMGIVDLVVSAIDYAYIAAGGQAVYTYWLTLQGIGVAILIALPFVRSKAWLKALVALILTIGFSVYHQTGDNAIYLEVMPHGGIMGTLGWGAMLLFDMAIADVYFERSKPMSYALSLFFLVLGIYLVQWLGPITMGTCSPTFILVGTGLSGAVFALFDVVDRFRPARFDFLAWWGKNPIILFLVEFFFVGIYTMVLPAAAMTDAPLWLAIIQGVLMTALLTAFTYWLSKRKAISV